MSRRSVFAVLWIIAGASSLLRAADRPRDLSKDKTLYCVGYAHLDTQWRWDFTTTIDKYLRATLEENFERFEKHPGYVFSFTGSARYHLMKEYYPEHFERLKQYIAAGRWFVSGSSVDEGDVNVPSAEVQVIMPGRTKEQRPLAATDERAIAATMAGPTASTKLDRESFPRMGNTDGFDD